MLTIENALDQAAEVDAIDFSQYDSYQLIRGEHIDDMMLFRMFNVNAGTMLSGMAFRAWWNGDNEQAREIHAKVQRNRSRDWWFETPRKRGGVSVDHDVDEQVDTKDAKAERLEWLKSFYEDKIENGIAVDETPLTPEVTPY